MLSFDKRFAKRPRQEAPDATAAHLFMATDAIEPKGPSTSFGLESDAIDGLIGDAAGVIEISGVIKWFDMAKGFGFIVPDNGLDDVLLHVSCLRRDGFQTAYEGARITVEAHQRAKGLQAFRIVSMDEFDSGSPGHAGGTADPCHRDTHQRSGARHRQVVQPHAWLWISHLRGRDAGYFCPHGNLAAVWNNRTAAGPDCAGAVWPRPQGDDGIRDSSRWRATSICVALGGLDAGHVKASTNRLMAGPVFAPA